jgi:TetR/AcrR family transcriptional repressor of nem operon
VGSSTAKRPPPATTRERLFRALISSVAEKGYAATAVDELCVKAGVSKGTFFHHFPSKQSLTVAAVNDWAKKCDAMYAAAPYHRFDDPLDRLLGFLDFRRDMLRAPMALASCPVGTMIQGVFESHPDILRACEECISSQVDSVESDIADAMKLHDMRSHWTPNSLALHTHSLLQGIYVLAKAKSNVLVAEESIDHLRRYIELLFRQSEKPAPQKKTAAGSNTTTSMPRRRGDFPASSKRGAEKGIRPLATTTFASASKSRGRALARAR